MRRPGSAYCGQCQYEGGRQKFYVSNDEFPLKEKVKKAFDLSNKDLEDVLFAYGDTIYYSKFDLSYGLVAHETTHLLQQEKIGRDEWWERYLKDKKFMLDQEIEAYRNQYRAYRLNDQMDAESLLDKIAGDLSGKLYGKIIDFETAKKLIKQENYVSI